MKTGQLMFAIDSRSFSDRLARAKSDLARDAGFQAQAAIEQNDIGVALFLFSRSYPCPFPFL